MVIIRLARGGAKNVRSLIWLWQIPATHAMAGL